MPKSKGNAYFISCKKGADKAAKELGVELLFDGPTDPDPAKQNEIVENWITLGVDAIAAACENKEGISTALRKAKAKGIKVITYDADALPDAREFFVNQATPEGIGYALMDEAARLCDNEGEFAIITASAHRGEQIEWQKYIEARRAEKYPNMKMVALRPCDDLKDKAQSEATALLSANPNLKLHHGDLFARRARRGRSRETGGQDRQGESHRPRSAERKQALRPRRRDRQRDSLEHRGPRLPDGLCRGCAGQRHAEARRQNASKPARSASSKSKATTSCSASRSSLTRTTSTSLISEACCVVRIASSSSRRVSITDGIRKARHESGNLGMETAAPPILHFAR